MKFWKPTVLATLLFLGIISVFVFTACERNVCDNVNCFNGGSCNSGLCHCPTGFEDPQCGTQSVTRYLGTYAGSTKCDSFTATIDSAFITTGSEGILSVDVVLNSIKPKVLHGYVSSNVSTYTITVTDNDSTFTDSSNYYRNFSITLQNDKTLTINTFEHLENKVDTFTHKCTFLGTKVTP